MENEKDLGTLSIIFPTPPPCSRGGMTAESGHERMLFLDKMAANLEEEEFLESASPIAPRLLNLEGTNTSENDGDADEIQNDDDEEEKNPLLELKKCKEWLLQQKLNHESELLVRKL